MGAPTHWDELRTLQSSHPNQESDLRLSINSPTGRVTLWVLVEGDADPYFYERLFDNSSTKVVKVGKMGTDGKLRGGCSVVKEIVANLLALGWTSRIIGIIDRDWRPFKNEAKLQLPPHIFITDQRDLEMTFLSYPSLREALRKEIIKSMNTNHLKWFNNGYWRRRNGDWFRDVWERCCEVSRYMGSLRIVASHYGLPRVDFISTDYWNAGQYALWEEWEARLFRRTMEQTKCCYLRLLYYSWRVKYKFDLNRRTIYDVCRGHDFLSAMSKMLIDNAHYSERWLTFFMTREMTIEDICSMQLYQNIDKWATSEGITMLVH